MIYTDQYVEKPPALLSPTPGIGQESIKLGHGERPKYVFRHRLIALEGGRVLLRLRRNPTVEVEPATALCSVTNWGLRIPIPEVDQISRLMGRRFLELFSKSQLQQLTASEKAQWIQILDEVDFAAFSTDVAAPRYVEGKIRTKGKNVLVEWHDGVEELVPPVPAAALEFLEENENFGAFAKWGRDNRVQAIERVILLPEEWQQHS
jgi:hypothetical protein